MKGWLIYNAQGAKRNEWFISRLIAEAKKRGADLELKIAANVNELLQEPLPDFAICRAMDARYNAVLEKAGVRTINNAKTALIAGDKWEAYRLCKGLDIPVLDTYLAEEGIYDKQYPLVVKSRFGHGGSEVFWSNNAQETERLVDKEGKYILQKPSDILGVDTRIYAVGGRIVAAVQRSAKVGFKSNFSLGGSVKAVQPSAEQKGIVDKLYQALHFDFIGIDFLPYCGGVVLNELEDAAGTRMLYSCTDIDVVPIYMRHVLNE